MERGRSISQSLSILLLPIALTFLPVCSSWAQSPLRRVAVLTPGLTFEPVFRGLQEGLTHHGYTERKNIMFIREDPKRSKDPVLNSQKLLAEKPDVIFAVTTAFARAAKQATMTVPIVFSIVADPVKDGLVSSIQASQNNLTGVMTGAAALSGKRLEFLLDVAPKTKRLLVVTSTDAIALSSFRFLEETAIKRSIHLVRRDASTGDEIEKVLREIPKGSMQAIFLIPSTSTRDYVGLLIEKAKAAKIPMIVHEDHLVADGALLSYGPGLKSMGVQAARLVAKVLLGGSPLTIPSEFPNHLILAINLRTAKEIGLKIPPTILGRADWLVE